VRIRFRMGLILMPALEAIYRQMTTRERLDGVSCGTRLPCCGPAPLASADASRIGVGDALVGRGSELELIRGFLDRAAGGGEALVVLGEPGVGKTALLRAAETMAVAAGCRLLAAAGVESEAEVTFSGLHQALLPLHEEIAQLTATYRDALNVALGFGEGPAPDRLLVANATLTVLRQAARAQPVLLTIDDLPWLDRTSAGVLGVVARRLAASRVGLLAASRIGEESFFERAGVPELELRPLEEEAARELMNSVFPTLAAPVRARVLAEAQGNPLAVLELPAALSGPQRAALRGLPEVLPLTRRLQAVFRSRVVGLSEQPRRLLLLMALDGTGDVRLLQATGDYHQGLDDLAATERARLAFLDGTTHRLTFRHPLIRSAVVELSTVVERRAAHALLAELRTDQPDRRAWHLAEASVGADEQVAGLLEDAGHRVLRRGDGVGAVTALIRAAELSPDAADRARRLAVAAFIGADVTGQLGGASQLLTDARRSAPELGGSLQAAVAAAYVLLNGEGDVDTAYRLLVGAIEGHANVGADGRTVLEEALHTLLFVCFFGARPELWKPFYDAVARLEPDVPAAIYLNSKTFADPVRMAGPALGQLDAAIDELADETDPTRIVRIAIASVFVDRIGGCREALWRVVRDGREGGAVASAIQALIMLGRDGYLSGQWGEAEQLAREAVELCETHGYEMFAWPGREILASLAAARGDYDRTQALTDRMIQWAAPRRIGAVHGYACAARVLAALGRSDFEEAYRHAVAISPAGTLASHRPYVTWVVMDLVEAAVHTGRRDEAAAHVAAMRHLNIAAVSSRLALLAAGSAAIAAPGDSGLRLFAEALALPGVERWQFDVARVQLAYGERLRRARVMTESRCHLLAALETFDRLGARPWADRAANELRATGQARARGGPGKRDPLTPQELEIATLAGSGLTNKQIGQRLYLSPRTVAAHLYRIFPKLGITSRAALRDALAAVTPSERNGDARG
jgi:DNA-binding CsgD family transcriptional regulator